MEKKNVYDLKSVKLPYLAGGALKFFTALVEGALGGLLVPNLLQSAGVSWLRKQVIDEAPTHHPIYHVKERGEETGGTELEAGEAKTGGFRFESIYDYAQAYREGVTTPEEVAERVLAAIRESNAANPALRAVIAVQEEDVRRQAREAGARMRAGRGLGVFDGVPVVVKDELDMRPYATKVGTAFLGQEAAAEDATVVARLRAKGALMVGKTNMHEIGINVTGLNPHHGTARNPYNPKHYTGGSSSGSAAAVGAGLAPVGLGADGGGSIRIPASFCGVFGLKATFGRVSEKGAAPLCWSVAHVGPLAGTATDMALAYAAICGVDGGDPNSQHQPAPSFEGWNRRDLKGVRLGVFRAWFEHAEGEVVEACLEMLKRLEAAGAEVREIEIPELELNRVAHTVTIVSEMVQAMSYTYAKHYKEHGLDVRLNLALGQAFNAQDYLLAQRARTRVMRNFNEALAGVDVIMTPSTAVAAPEIKGGALPDGESDLSTTVEIMRFATPANLTGLPAVSFPAGYTRKGLPIGMQAMGRAWEENLLLRVAMTAEQAVERRAPEVFYRVL